MGQHDECFRALDLNAPVAAFAPLGRIGRVRAKPGVPLALLACPGLGAFAPLGRTLNAGLACIERWIGGIERWIGGIERWIGVHLRWIGVH